MMLNEKPGDMLDSFLSEYKKIYDIDINKARQIIKDTKKFYEKKSDIIINYAEELENRWCNSLNNKIDYSVYDDEYYFTDLWVCWSMYSRTYLKKLLKENSLTENSSVISIFENVKSVIDLGCGIGYTTSALTEMFKSAQVYGYNIADTKQYEFCKKQSERYNFKMCSDLKTVGQIDVVFASEYFEHIERPLEHLKELIELINPKYFIIANSFNTKSVGHFWKYLNNDDVIESEKISKLFNNTLRSLSFKSVKTKLFNNKPMIWSRM